MSAPFKDHFSRHAKDYAGHRPGYPPELFDWLADSAPRRELAWDCATGNGQAATELARRFRCVIATDASGEQIAQAQALPGLVYRVEPAEYSSLDDHSADLVTVAQAVHWFDQQAFCREVERVARAGALLAVWCYALARVTAAIDRVVGDFYSGPLGPCWPPERSLVEQAYAGLDFPGSELPAPAFSMLRNWCLDDFEAYLGTWSAVQAFRREHGQDPLELLHGPLASAWGDPAARRVVTWPLHLRVFRLT